MFFSAVLLTGKKKKINIYIQVHPRDHDRNRYGLNNWYTGHLNNILTKKGEGKVQGVPKSQTAVLPRHQEEKETYKTKQAQIEQTYERLALSSPKRGNRNAKRTEKHKNKITQGKT